MATFFDRLPYDILPLIFDCLDIKTLLDAALASHVLNEIASLSLYTSITFNQDAEHGMWYARSNDNEKRKNPILALHRRPHLRKVVRSVVLCTSSSWAPRDKNEENALLCYEEMLRLPNVKFLAIKRYSLDTECELLSKLFPKLRNLQILNIEDDARRERDYDLSSLPAQQVLAYLTDETLRVFSSGALAPKVKSLIWDGYSCDLTAQDLSKSLAPFTRLTRFTASGGNVSTPSEICYIIKGAPSLCEGLFVCSLEPENADMFPTGAKHLTYLRIRLTSKCYPDEAKTLGRLVHCISGTSQLRRLDLHSLNRKPKVIKGDPVLDGVLRLHGPTLEKLKIRNFHLSSSQLRRILLRCKRLNVLWFGAAPTLKGQIPALLANAQVLEKIRIYCAGKWDFAYVEALFHQTCPSMRVVKICDGLAYGVNAVWKSQWEYDEMLQKAVRQIEGQAKFASV